MCPHHQGREQDFNRNIDDATFYKVVDDALQYGLKTVSLQGSGEPTLNKKFPQYVQYVKNKGLYCYALTNGLFLRGDFARKVLDSGIDLLRISAIGYDRASYKQWMNRDSFDQVRNNCLEILELIDKYNYSTELHLYHLITDATQQEIQTDLYKVNWLEYFSNQAYHEVWMMHNWAGSYEEVPYSRQQMLNTRQKRSCGRPFGNILEVRAGGIDGQHGAVVPCCMVLGRDSEAVLGHLDRDNIADVYNGKLYTELRHAHTEGRFDDVSYCKNCDQLYDYPESLVWTNIPNRKYGTSKTLNTDLRYAHKI